LYAASGEQRGALQAASVERAIKLVAEALGEAATLRELRAEGATLSDGDAAAMAFGDA
jgi:hypothetical protein